MDGGGTIAPALTGVRLDGVGRPRADIRAILWLAIPLIGNSVIQAVLTLTDTWFVSRISAEALAGLSAVSWLLMVQLFMVAGLGFATQPMTAQAEGAGRRAAAGHILWQSLWASALSLPFFVLMASLGGPFLALVDLPAEIAAPAAEYWAPRLLGGPVCAALWAVNGFLAGIGRTGAAFWVTVTVAAANLPLNQIMIFEMGMGMAGAAWATNLAMLLGVGHGLALVLTSGYRRRYRTEMTWRPRRRSLIKVIRMGLPLGFMIGVDILGIALVWLMIARIGVVEAAASHIAASLSAIGFWPAIGLASAGTTLVGQAFGARRPEIAHMQGTLVIRMVVLYMAAMGLLFGLGGRLLASAFVADGDPLGPAVLDMAALLLVLVASYQLLDGFNFASSFCLRGAGDVTWPARVTAVASLLVLVPLAHSLTFTDAQAWIPGLPQFGLGANGAWLAVCLYVGILGVSFYLRWVHARWRLIPPAPPPAPP